MNYDHDISHLIGLIEMARIPPKTRSRVEKLFRDGICIVPDCGKKAWRRGCCIACYARFNRARNAKSKTGRAKFEIQCVTQGLVLPIGESRKLRVHNPFRKVG